MNTAHLIGIGDDCATQRMIDAVRSSAAPSFPPALPPVLLSEHEFAAPVTLKDLRLKCRELMRSRQVGHRHTLVAKVSPDTWMDIRAAWPREQVWDQHMYSDRQRQEQLPGEMARIEAWRIVVPEFIDTVDIKPAFIAFIHPELTDAELRGSPFPNVLRADQ
jgi:hypothetical protein